MARWSGSPRPAEETGGWGAGCPSSASAQVGGASQIRPSEARGAGLSTWPPEEGPRIRVPPAAGGGGADLGLLGGLSWGRGSESTAARGRGHGPVSPPQPRCLGWRPGPPHSGGLGRRCGSESPRGPRMGRGSGSPGRPGQRARAGLPLPGAPRPVWCVERATLIPRGE